MGKTVIKCGGEVSFHALADLSSITKLSVESGAMLSVLRQTRRKTQ